MKAILITAVAGMGLSVAGYFYGLSHGRDIEAAKYAATEQAVREARDAMIQAAAEQIAKIEVRHQTIRQEVQREIVEKPVYRDCRHSPDTFRLLNDALQNRDIQPPGSGVLPGTDPAG